MNKVTIVSLATVSAALVVGVTALEAVTVATTHSANPFNMKTNSDFKNMVESKKISGAKNFENVKAFVDAKGRGTLIAKKTDKSGELEFKYYKHGETINLSKGDIVFRDWGAVREYMSHCDKVSVEETKESIESTESAKSTENVPPVVEHTKAAEPIVNEKYQMSDELKNVLARFNIGAEEFDKILHTFFVAKRCYMRSTVYSNFGKRFNGFYPEGRKTSFLQAYNESRMKEAFYGEMNWQEWKSIAGYGWDLSFNPVVACYCWVCGLDGSVEVSEELNGEKPEVVQRRVKNFVEVFCALAGVNEGHMRNPSQI